MLGTRELYQHRAYHSRMITAPVTFATGSGRCRSFGVVRLCVHCECACPVQYSSAPGVPGRVLVVRGRVLCVHARVCACAYAYTCKGARRSNVCCCWLSASSDLRLERASRPSRRSQTSSSATPRFKNRTWYGCVLRASAVPQLDMVLAAGGAAVRLYGWTHVHEVSSCARRLVCASSVFARKERGCALYRHAVITSPASRIVPYSVEPSARCVALV